MTSIFKEKNININIRILKPRPVLCSCVSISTGYNTVLQIKSILFAVYSPKSQICFMNFTICTNIRRFLSLEALLGLEKLHKNYLTELKKEKSQKKKATEESRQR